jgi:hypothetical protein
MRDKRLAARSTSNRLFIICEKLIAHPHPFAVYLTAAKRQARHLQLKAGPRLSDLTVAACFLTEQNIQLKPSGERICQPIRRIKKISKFWQQLNGGYLISDQNGRLEVVFGAGSGELYSISSRSVAS